MLYPKCRDDFGVADMLLRIVEINYGLTFEISIICKVHTQENVFHLLEHIS